MEHIQQANDGCDFDLLEGGAATPEPNIDESMFRICDGLRFVAIHLLVLGCQGFTSARQDAHVTPYSYK
jgi:hypothetical protein